MLQTLLFTLTYYLNLLMSLKFLHLFILENLLEFINFIKHLSSFNLMIPLSIFALV
jgi:hypothetical protein